MKTFPHRQSNSAINPPIITRNQSKGNLFQHEDPNHKYTDNELEYFITQLIKSKTYEPPPSAEAQLLPFLKKQTVSATMQGDYDSAERTYSAMKIMTSKNSILHLAWLLLQKVLVELKALYVIQLQ